MIERQIELASAGGAMGCFIVHPRLRGAACNPIVLFFMDAPGIREELRDMARRIATAGYYVMLPNLYLSLGGRGARRRAARTDDGFDGEPVDRLGDG